MKTNLLLLLAVSALVACQTRQEWNGGAPRSGARMSNDERIAEHAKFIISGIREDRIVTRGKEGDEIAYTLDSFKPAFDGVDKTIYPDVVATWPYSYVGMAGVIIGTLGATRMSFMEDRKFTDPTFMAAAAVSGLGTGTFLYCQYHMSNVFSDALDRYQLKLDQLLFPEGQLAMGLRLSW